MKTIKCKFRFLKGNLHGHMFKLKLCKYSTKMKEWKLRGSELLLDGSPVEVQIARYSCFGDLVSHCSLDNSRSLLCFIAGQFTLRLLCLLKSLWIVSKSNHNVTCIFLHHIPVCWKHWDAPSVFVLLLSVILFVKRTILTLDTLYVG